MKRSESGRSIRRKPSSRSELIISGIFCISRSSAYRRSGFTLLELVVVIAIIAIITAISIPLYQGYLDNRVLTTAMGQVQSDLRKAQQNARATSMKYEVQFVPLATTYTIYSRSPTNPSLLTTIETIPLPGEVQVLNTTISQSPVNTIVYNPPFSKSETRGGSVSFRSPKGRAKTITVSPTNGEITLSP